MQNDYGLQINNGRKIFQTRKQIFEPKPSNIISLHLRPNASAVFKGPNFLENQKYLNADFDFKHVPKLELETILKRFRREKRKQQDVYNWNCYVKSKLKKDVKEKAEISDNLISASEITSCEECGRLTSGKNFLNKLSIHKEEHLGVAENVNPEKIISSPMIRNSTIDVNQSHNYQLGPGLTKRLQDLLDTVRKMTSVLLSPQLGTQHEDEDVDRTIQRSLQFDAMFTRNHLYEIQRIFKDMKQIITGKTVMPAELENKISAILKSIAQALQVYTRHVSKGSVVKCQQVFPIFECITTTQTILENISGQQLLSLGQELEVACSYLKEVLLEMSATETKSVSHKCPKIRLRHKPSADLSMYSRRQREWRKKTASLARARFGPPRSKKHYKNSEYSKTLKDAYGVANKTVSSEKDSNSNCKTTTMQTKDPVHCKELLFRSATRGVPEEQVTTMMETIPKEPLDSSDFYIDDSTFQTLKLLTQGFPPERQETFVNVEEPKADNVQEPPVTLKAEEECVITLKPNKKNMMDKLKSGKEMANVKLVCVKERPDSTRLSSKKGNMECEKTVKTEKTPLTIETQSELLEYQQKISKYQESSPLYKDEKAIGIIDRLASRFLKEMLIDFQQNEMDQVIRTLYNLEFE